MKIVLASEMSRIEKLSFQLGASDEAYMEKVGQECAAFLLEHFSLASDFVLLAGKGGNGGDAFVVGFYLLEKGAKVRAITLFSEEESSSLCKKNRLRFQEKGGSISLFQGIVESFESTIFIDGLFGTGFSGGLDTKSEKLVSCVNALKKPIISIDIPSGLNGNSGIIENRAIEATYTLYLEFPKWGFFIQDGPKVVGKLFPILFGLDESCKRQAKSHYELLEDKEIASYLPYVLRTRHKYERGYVVGFSGSLDMPGASILSSVAALRAGSGIVRLILPSSLENTSFTAYPEVIRFFYKPDCLNEVRAFFDKASGIYMGPGLSLDPSVKQVVKSLLEDMKKPIVLDADLLTMIAQDHTIPIPQDSILTPHLLEMSRLLNCPCPEQVDEIFLDQVQAFAKKHHVNIVLKGVPTFIFSHKGEIKLSMRGDPSMATAGSGDVLTGIITSLVSQKVEPYKAALLGVYLHGLAGEKATLDMGSYSLIASDLITYLPKAFQALIETQ